MKPILLFFILSICAFQNSVPPQKISNSLVTKFPSAKSITWQKGVYYGPDVWKASFILGSKKATATYTSEAKWLETTLEISEKELNETVKSSIIADYPKCEIISAIITELSYITWYKVKIQFNNKVFEVSYDYQGMKWPPRI